MWVRGLKPYNLGYTRILVSSHPVWVRGLKPDKKHIPKTAPGSHPVWVRGLKLVLADPLTNANNVAPRVGAWIETLTPLVVCAPGPVAPRVGAWIETSISLPSGVLLMSHPVWVRGLKPE